VAGINFEDYFPSSDTTYPFIPHAHTYDTVNFKSKIAAPILDNGGQVYNVKNYGAKGDGVTDDTAAIQATINVVIAAGGGTVFLPAGHYMVSTFLDTTHRSALTIDSGIGLNAGQPIVVNITGATPINCSTLNILTTPNSYPLGSAVIDCSNLDVLQFGLYKQGRIFFVPPYTASSQLNAINALYLNVANMVIIPPIYCAAGTGPGYSIQTFSGTQSLFINGNSLSGNQAHFSFVNSVDAYMASGLTVKGVSVQSAIAALNPTGNQFAGGGGVRVLGPGAGFVYPFLSNQGNNIAEGLSTFDVPIGAFFSSHVSCDQLYVQNGRIGIYAPEGGHGSISTRINIQETNFVVQHALLPQLTTSFSGASPFCYDPRGDVFAMGGQTFPTSASAGSMIILDASIEAPAAFLNDDAANPLTLVADIEATGTITPASIWGAGANLVVNFMDVASHGQTTLNGTTAGTVKYSQSGKTPWDKRFVAYLNGYNNTTGTSQTITFLNAYNVAPAIVKDATTGVTVSATTLTLPNSMGSPVTGYVILEGY